MLQVCCRRILSALLPTAELLLRALMDARQEHWQESMSGKTVQDAVAEARRMAPETCTARQSSISCFLTGSKQTWSHAVAGAW